MYSFALIVKVQDKNVRLGFKCKICLVIYRIYLMQLTAICGENNRFVSTSDWKREHTMWLAESPKKVEPQWLAFTEESRAGWMGTSPSPRSRKIRISKLDGVKARGSWSRKQSGGARRGRRTAGRGHRGATPAGTKRKWENNCSEQCLHASA